MRSAVVTDEGWPSWARTQLATAIDIAASVGSGRPLATELYERWFSGPAVGAVAARPLVGEYRRAHAAVATSVIDGLPVLELHDGIGRDGWWRTWNTSWRPRRTGTRILLSPRPDAAAEVVGVLTASLRDVPYLLTCPTASTRLSCSGSIVLYVPEPGVVPPGLVESVADLLRPDTPPLCLPVAPGVAVAQYPDNGMTFGEHRCHLVALALRTSHRAAALSAIADVFIRNGVEPSAPYRAARRTGGA